jgi:glycosyltransferase involved in cell wall biosynthesis
MTKVLILNELHPGEQPGAATIAFDYAKALSKISQTIFFYTNKSENDSITGLLRIKGVRRNQRKHVSGYYGEFCRVLRDLLALPTAIRYLREIKSVNPNLLWIHQIGNHIPRLLLFFLPLICPTIMTVHDYSFIVPRKLYPKDLNKRHLAILGVPFFKSNQTYGNSLASTLKQFMYMLRRGILRQYCRRIRIICISQQQAQIYRIFGFKVHSIIPNGINECTCVDSHNSFSSPSVLFLGRVTGKGVERLLSSVSQLDIQLFLAGPEELRNVVDAFPGKLKYKYLGNLDRAQVFQEIHKVSMVYLASDCFDVFPTTGIEAIRHGAIPIVSDTTGLRDLVHYISPDLVLTSSQAKIPFENYLMMIKNHKKELMGRLYQANLQLPTIDKSLKEYLTKW